MVVDRNTLSETYASKSDEELLLLHKAGTLTELAYEVLEGELSRRELPIPLRTDIVPDEPKKLKSRIAYIIWAAILVSIVSAINQVMVHPNRDERRKLAVENAISTVRSTAMQKFLNGEDLNNAELMQLLPDFVEATNKQLPSMIDEVTRIESMDVHGGQAIYRNTLLDWDPGESDVRYFHDFMHKEMKSAVCNDRLAWLLLKNDFTLTYSYSMVNGHHITDVSFHKSDCLLALKE